ncbi:MAG: DUF2752 domain-containing protein [Dehalococcoidia bacterium]|nr:DUF2752 domain-containing protein [Dehalococcoidia bacterium]
MPTSLRIPLLDLTATHYWMSALALGLGAASYALIYPADPTTSGTLLKCPFHAITGYYCPGCGTLRALHDLSHGHLLAALRHNVLIACAVPYLGYAVISGAAFNQRRGLLPWPELPSRLTWILLGFAIFFGFARNISSWPFNMLAP